MSDTKLLPCPFCGRTPKSQENRAGGLHIFCSHEACGQSEVEGDYQEAIAAWNTRAPHPAAEGLAKALEAIADGSCFKTDANGTCISDHQSTARAALARYKGSRKVK